MFSKIKSKAAKFQVRTPNAVMSIRGTDFAVKVDADKTNVGLFEGQIAVSNKEGKEVLLEPNQEAAVNKQSAPVKMNYLSQVMLKEQKRYEKFKAYVDGVRK